jgi:pilus assembly protein Flp/PilA
MSGILKSFWHNDDGATAIEYALIAGIVSIGIIGSADGIADSLVTAFGKIDAKLDQSVSE